MNAPGDTSPDGAAVELSALVRRFGAVTAIDGLSFTVRPGELFGLVGPDGAGKTTTLRILAGVLRVTSGDVRVLGVDMTKTPERAKDRIAYMSQRFGLYTDLTVAENLDFYADLYDVPPAERPARLDRLYQFSNLGPFQDRLAGKLSGGMKQKLGLSCALIHEPKLLLLDEPTFGVDPVSRRDLWVIVHEMVARGVTAVVSTAYMDEAERFDRLALLHQGRAIALDSPRALQATLEGRLLSVRVDRVREARRTIEALPGVLRATVFGDSLHVTLDAASARAGEIVRALTSAGFQAGDASPVTPSLEDVFMDRLAGVAAS